MNKLLRILIVEDSEDDALLVVQEFKQAGYDVSFERVQTEAAMDAALSKEKWDTIISDYALPDFSGTAALRLLQRKGIDLPFILVSGKIGEDSAVEIIKAGAHDYLMKNNLKRLVVCVEQEVREAENRRGRKKTEEALTFSNIILRTQQESSIDGILVVDEKGEILSFNQRFVNMWGIPLDVLESKSDERALESVMDKLATPEEFIRKVKYLYEVWDGISRDEVVLKDGRTFDRYSAPMLGAEKKYYGRVWYFRDITERKQAEEKLKKSTQFLRDVGEMAKIGGWELDLSTKEVLWTEEVGRIHGVEPGYKPKLEEALNFYAPESRPDVEAVLKKAAETGESYDLESLFIPSGSKDKIWVRSLGRAVYRGGKIVKLAGTFQNIDKYKKGEEALRESEERYRIQFEQTIDALFLADAQTGIILECNRAAMELIGREKSEMVGQHQRILHPSEEWDGKFSKSFKQHIIGETFVETKVIKKSGEIRDVAIKASTFDLKGKKVILAIFHDITKRKKIEEENRKHMQELEVFYKASIGREERIIELKKEIEQLKKELGK